MAFTGICGPVGDAPLDDSERAYVLHETERMLRDDPEAWHALFDFLAAGWLADMNQVNGAVLRYNPSGRRYERMELRLMAAQDSFDRLGVSGEKRAATAEELLARATLCAGSPSPSARAALAGTPRGDVFELPLHPQDERTLAAVS